MEIFIILSMWLWLDLLLNIVSKTYRNITIKILQDIDKDVETYWNSIWRKIKNYLLNIFSK